MAQRTANKPVFALRGIIANKADLAGYIIVVLPILAYWIYWTLNPSYWYNGDPAAFYMVDSLSVFDGGTYTYVDHPGTPMQVVGTVFLALTYPFFDSYEAFINFYITRPEAFFLMAHVFLLAANLATILIFYRIARKTLGENSFIEAIALSVMFFALNPYSFPSLTFWSHNSLNFPFGTLLLLWLFHELQGESDIKRHKLVIMGLAAGILAIAQIYFFVWLATFIITAFVFTYRIHQSLKQAFRQSLYVLLGGILGIIAMLLPIYRDLPRFIKWTMQVALHSGAYGTGERGVFPISLIPAAFTIWWNHARPMVIVLLLGLMALLVFAYLRNRLSARVQPGVYAMIIGSSFHLFFLFILLIKAALKLRYTLSLAATLPILILLVLKLSEGIEWKRAVFTRIFSVLVCVGVVTSLVQEINLAERRSYVEEDARLAKSRAVTLLAREMGVAEKDLVVVHAFAVPLQCSGMLEASNWTGAFKEEVAAMCVNQHAIFDSVVELNTYEPVPGIEDIDWDLVIWPGNGSDLPDYLESVGAVIIPDSWHVRRNKWFYIRSEVLNK
jgi:hypothetical protein